MSTTTRIILILVAWFLYVLALQRFCTRQLCENCSTTGIIGDEAGVEENPYALAFRWGDATPFAGPGIDSLQAAVMAGSDNANVLEIVGKYYAGEVDSPEEGEQLGLERARQIRDQFFPDLPDRRVKLSAKVIAGNAPEDAREGYFEAAVFNWGPSRVAGSNLDSLLELGVSAKFPFDSDTPIQDRNIDEYLDKVAREVEVDPMEEPIVITGHTDNVGTHTYNQALGQRRAEAVKRLLVRLGVPEEHLRSRSKGETDPIAPNTTPEGRAQNRRVEFQRAEN